jgi:endonuclease/exonuclease/phosphatase family metal-dependent hydrolase
MKTLLKILFWIVVVAVMVVASLIFYATFSDYKPGKTEVVFENLKADAYPAWTEIDLMIWNIGYCGLSSDMDFFYDGGKKVRPSEEQLLKNLQAVVKELQQNDTMEFILLQEVDVKSKRSYKVCEFDSIESGLPNYHSFFGKNYDVFFVPLPPAEPMGKVKSGLQTLSVSAPSSSVRYSYPGKFAWPKSLFMLDRCFLVNRYPMANGRELLIINTHNSAYDAAGILRTQEMNYLKSFLTAEYDKGNYIIVGGDWNQSPPGYQCSYTSDVFDKEDFTTIPDSFLPDTWKWVYDPAAATNRRVIFPYKRGITTTTIIDFYLLSPNVEALAVNTIDKEFSNADHQPVRLKVRLIK